jgi:glucokinase
MYLGIEIGGTKLQLGVGAGDGSPLVALERVDVDPLLGANGILAQIKSVGTALLDRYEVVMLDENGGPHITDYGLSHRLDADDQITQSGDIVGTPA